MTILHHHKFLVPTEQRRLYKNTGVTRRLYKNGNGVAESRIKGAEVSRCPTPVGAAAAESRLVDTRLPHLHPPAGIGRRDRCVRRRSRAGWGGTRGGAGCRGHGCRARRPRRRPRGRPHRRQGRRRALMEIPRPLTACADPEVMKDFACFLGYVVLCFVGGRPRPEELPQDSSCSRIWPPGWPPL